MIDDVLLTEAEVAERLKLKKTTLRNWRHRKGGPKYILIGVPATTVRYKLSDVLAFVEAGQ